MNIRLLGLGVAGVGLVAATTVWALGHQRKTTAPSVPVAAVEAVKDDGDDGDEVVIGLSDLPEAVRTALAGVTSDAAVTQVARETEDGRTTYDVEYTKDGAKWAVEFTESGSVLENELDDDDHDDEDGNDND